MTMHQRSAILNAMSPTARVQNGRLVLDEPTDLPEGEIEQLEMVSKDWANEDNWSPAPRERLDAALSRGSAEVASGKAVDAREFVCRGGGDPLTLPGGAATTHARLPEGHGHCGAGGGLGSAPCGRTVDFKDAARS